MVIPLLLCLTLLTYLVIRHIQHCRFLSNFRTPGITWPIIGHALTFFNVKADTILSLMNRLAKRDPKGRMIAALAGPQMTIFVYHPETVEPILGSAKHIRKSFQYDFLVPWLGEETVFLSNGEKWKRLKRQFNPVYGIKIIETIIGASNKNGDLLSECLLLNSNKGTEIIDVCPCILNCTMDLILECTLGQKLQEKHCSKYSECLRTLARIIFKRATLPCLWPEWIFKVTSENREFQRCLQFINEYGGKMIQDKSNRDSQDKSLRKSAVTFIDLYIAQRRQQDTPITNERLVEDVNGILIAGWDNLARTISWTLLLLANHSTKQAKVLEEQREIFGEEHDIIEDVKQEQLSRMKYLECCIKETLRLYPPVPILGRAIDEDGLLLDGIAVPKGTHVYVCLLQLHRNPKIWEAPDEFWPERFLVESRSNKRIHPYAYLPFGGGPRICPGLNISMTPIKVILSKLVRRMELVKVSSVEEVGVVVDIVTKPKGEINMLFRERTSDTSSAS